MVFAKDRIKTIEDLAKLQNTFHKKIKRQLKYGIISREIFELKFNYRITDNFKNLSDCDLVTLKVSIGTA